MARRRCALRCLAESPGPLIVSELSRRVPREEQVSNAIEASGGAEGTAREHASLYHVDPPKPVDDGPVDYDPEARRARLADPDPCPGVEAGGGLLAALGDTADRP